MESGMGITATDDAGWQEPEQSVHSPNDTVKSNISIKGAKSNISSSLHKMTISVEG